MLRRMRRLSCLFLGFSLLLVGLAALSSCKKTSSGPHSCAADADCEISCDARGDCCNSPYCEQAQHAEDARENREANAKSCTAEQRKNCPQVGARMAVDYRVVPKCQASKCIAEKVPK
jgi:hypothetical protein